MEAIVYTSNTGSAAQYAEMLAKETGLAAYSLDEARGKVPADSEVIYLGWVMAGTVKGTPQRRSGTSSARSARWAWRSRAHREKSCASAISCRRACRCSSYREIST